MSKLNNWFIEFDIENTIICFISDENCLGNNSHSNGGGSGYGCSDGYGYINGNGSGYGNNDSYEHTTGYGTSQYIESNYENNKI